MTRAEREIAKDPAAEAVPLVLDVDGTLLRTDLLLECVWDGLGRAPLETLAALRLWRDRAALKARLAEIAEPRIDLMPVAGEVAEIARAAQAEGREVILASASDRRLVAELAAAKGFSPRVFGSDGQTNLKGQAKAEALVAAFGPRGFDYAGNGPEDVAVWAQARRAVVVGQPRGTEALRAQAETVTLPGGWAPRALLKAMRPHQWVKNVLLLLPMVAAHEFGLATLLPVLLGIVAFSLAASSIYVVNDLLDLEADRLHATKCRRPFASGTVPIPVGMAAATLAGLGALALAAALGSAALLAILVYMALSLAYSLRLKRLRWIDVATLATLYTLRVVAGAAAGAVVVSTYMLVFVFPIFLTLGCVKRLTEVARAKTDARLPGRGYARGDRGDLVNVASVGVVATLVIFFLYSFSDQGAALYPMRWLLWVALLPIAAWLVRMVQLGWAGRMDYDPIVFALRDKAGLGYLSFALALMFYAAGLWREVLGL